MNPNPFQGKHGPLLIAEIGGNHEGNFEYAKKLTELAIAADVDYIKYQLYSGDTLVSKVEGKQRNQHFKKFELTKEQHIQLAEMCQSAGIGYMASIWGEEYIDWIDAYMPIYKIGSGDLTAYPMLKCIAQLNKPMIISTGLATLQEVLDSVAYIQQVNPIYNKPENLAVLQCTSMYPIPYEEANLAVMHTLRESTQLTIGYSDHTIGDKALEISVAMGAQVLEFHFTDSRENKVFRDHKVSLTKDETLALIKKIRDIKTLQGSKVKEPTQSELESGHVTSFRRAVYLTQDLEAGTVLKEEHLTSLRPNHGIDARAFDELIGKTLTTNLKAHESLKKDYFK